MSRAIAIAACTLAGLAASGAPAFADGANIPPPWQRNLALEVDLGVGYFRMNHRPLGNGAGLATGLHFSYGLSRHLAAGVEASMIVEVGSNETGALSSNGQRAASLLVRYYPRDRGFVQAQAGLAERDGVFTADNWQGTGSAIALGAGIDGCRPRIGSALFAFGVRTQVGLAFYDDGRLLSVTVAGAASWR